MKKAELHCKYGDHKESVKGQINISEGNSIKLLKIILEKDYRLLEGMRFSFNKDKTIIRIERAMFYPEHYIQEIKSLLEKYDL